MSETKPSITNISISQIDSGCNFQSEETPLVYSSAMANNSVKITVIAPFHSNANPIETPTITASTGKNGNELLITPAYDRVMPLSTIYTQVLKISFTLNNLSLDKESAVINVSVDEKGKSVKEAGGLGAPIRKTKIVLPGDGN